uniref:Uncharacterized protein n=1 Tax=Arundo donax TaxID=35708 RepID=A0A0A9AVF9_ARUDO
MSAKAIMLSLSVVCALLSHFKQSTAILLYGYHAFAFIFCA